MRMKRRSLGPVDIMRSHPILPRLAAAPRTTLVFRGQRSHFERSVLGCRKKKFIGLGLFETQLDEISLLVHLFHLIKPVK